MVILIHIPLIEEKMSWANCFIFSPLKTVNPSAPQNSSVFLPHVQEEEETSYCYERKCILRCSQFFPSWLLLLTLPFLPSSVSSPYQIISLAYKQHSPLMPQPTSISIPLLCSFTAKYLKCLSSQAFSTFLFPCYLK